MKVIFVALFLMTVAGCGQNRVEEGDRSKKIGIHIFTSTALNNQLSKWYYIKKINANGGKGYYLQSSKAVEDFNNANFVYHDTRPESFDELYPLKERLILVDAADLPGNMQQSIADLESITVWK